LRAQARYLLSLRRLPLRVAWFQWRARRLASRLGDRFSLTSSTRAADLAVLLKVARNRCRVVELGTGTGWTALALALADPRRHVVTYDPVDRPERRGYVELVASQVSDRVSFVCASGASGPADELAVDLLYIDSSHGREETIEEFRAWEPALALGALVIFDDFPHPDFPGVQQAVRELGLAGEQHGTLFVHEIAAAAAA
jgi:predicted O-methyltransferase YrrM